MIETSYDFQTRAGVESFLLDSLASGSTQEIEAGFRDTKTPGTLETLIPGFMDLGSCDQGTLHHREGNALLHTAKVFANVARLTEGMAREDRYLLLVAALAHDIDKPSTRAVQGEKITFYGHAEKAEERSEAMAQNFYLTADEMDRLSFLVRNHMTAHLLQAQGEKKRLEFYESPHFSSLIILQEADALASWQSPDGTQHGKVLREFYDADRAQLLEQKTAAAFQKTLINQMERTLTDLGISPGPYFGKVRKALKAAVDQRKVLTQTEVANFVTGFVSNNPPK